MQHKKMMVWERVEGRVLKADSQESLLGSMYTLAFYGGHLTTNSSAPDHRCASVLPLVSVFVGFPCRESSSSNSPLSAHLASVN
ncbi:hypothetical protein CDAR_213321 [Caerostris darwini]|uniref:Uncharacterized protein n=1 Tax=Caerostris darwini TaxID=1538125 RepID=A0AAV4PY96_9ARAC|nr:hypothetical protein CDAR_213321 [Caerostris darwini]